MTREMAIQVLQTALIAPFIYGEYAEALDMAIEALLADAVEVVRCKDCKHLYKDGECPLRTWFTHTEEDFCSYGERGEIKNII